LQYHGVEPRILRRTLADLDLDLSSCVFVDIGSGKGKALMVASEWPFRRVVGIEFAVELHEAAAENLRRFRSTRQRCFAVESVNADALAYALPDDPLVLFLNNAFQGELLARFLEHVRGALTAHPRPFRFVYMNPEARSVVEATGWLEPISTSLDIDVWRVRPGAIPGF
jgi:trans-aconitate methyltransferase